MDRTYFGAAQKLSMGLDCGELGGYVKALASFLLVEIMASILMQGFPITTLRTLAFCECI